MQRAMSNQCSQKDIAPVKPQLNFLSKLAQKHRTIVLVLLRICLPVIENKHRIGKLDNFK